MEKDNARAHKGRGKIALALLFVAENAFFCLKNAAVYRIHVEKCCTSISSKQFHQQKAKAKKKEFSATQTKMDLLCALSTEM